MQVAWELARPWAPQTFGPTYHYGDKMKIMLLVMMTMMLMMMMMMMMLMAKMAGAALTQTGLLHTGRWPFQDALHCDEDDGDNHDGADDDDEEEDVVDDDD